MAETLAGEATEVIDATGALVTPGLIDIPLGVEADVLEIGALCHHLHLVVDEEQHRRRLALRDQAALAPEAEAQRVSPGRQ